MSELICITPENVDRELSDLARAVRLAFGFGPKLRRGTLEVTLPDGRKVRLGGTEPGPAEEAATMDAPSRFAHRMNRGFADATCNLVTAVMLPLEPNAYSSCTEGPRTVLFGQQSPQSLG